MSVPESILKEVIPNKSLYHKLKEVSTFKWITIIVTVICFIVVFTFGMIKRGDAEQYYIHYGSGCLFIMSLWYFLISVIITYVGFLYIIITTKHMNLWMMFTVIIAVIFNLIFNLLIYYFIPDIDATSNTGVFVVSILSIVLNVFLALFIYNNSKTPIISYIFLILILVINAFGITLKIKNIF